MLNKYYKYFVFVFINSSKVFSFTFSQICVFVHNYILFTFDGLFCCFSSVRVITPFTPFCLHGFLWYIVLKTSARESHI